MMTQWTPRKRVLFVGNDGGYFLTHRLHQAVAARELGYEVHVATPNSPQVERIREQGFAHHTIPADRWATHPFGESRLFLSLIRLFYSLRPDIAYLVTVKPVLYGGLAARMVRVPAVVYALTGLGSLFVGGKSELRFLRRLVKLLLRLSLNHPRSRVIFQNPDDMEMFVADGTVSLTNALLIRGSGVDIEKYRPSPDASGLPLVIFPSRMLWNKGLGEFIEAACILRSKGIVARFALVGDVEVSNPASATQEQILAWKEKGLIEWWGYCANMPDVYAQAHIVCLPSYREGLPKALIEAASSGKPIVTCDVPGCREIVQHGINGLLVPPRDPTLLANALEHLIADPSARIQMGIQGRQIAATEYSEQHVSRALLRVFRDLTPS